jgi:hypothetical protein
MKTLTYLILFLAMVNRVTAQLTSPGQTAQPSQNYIEVNGKRIPQPPQDVLVRLYRVLRQTYDGGNLLLSLINHDENSDSFSVAQIESTSESEGAIDILNLADPASSVTKIQYKVMRFPAGSQAGGDNGLTNYSPYYTRVGVKEYAVVQTRYNGQGGTGLGILKGDTLEYFPPTMIISDSWLSPVADLLTGIKSKSLKEIRSEDLLTTAPQADSLDFLYAAVKLANDDPAQFVKAFPALVPKFDEISASILTRILIISSVALRNGGHITSGAAGIQDSDLSSIISSLKEAA